MSRRSAERSLITADLSSDTDHVHHNSHERASPSAQANRFTVDVFALTDTIHLNPVIPTDARVAEAVVASNKPQQRGFMKIVQDAVFDALVRAGIYLDENDAALKGVDLAAARQRLNDAVTAFRTHALDQDVGTRNAMGETATQRKLRIKLRREQMRPVALIASRNLRSVPQFAALQMPKPYARGQAFLASARGMAEAAAIHKDALIAHGMPSTFVDDFTAAVAKFEASLSDRAKNFNQHVKATEALSVEEKNGRTVLGVLDAIVQQALGDDAALLSAWKSARRIRQRPGARSGATVPATTPAATPSAAATPAAVTAVAPTPQPVGEVTPPAAAA